MREHKENVTSKGWRRTNGRCRGELKWRKALRSTESGAGKRERCDRIFGGKRRDRIKRKKESGRQKPESDRHRWQRDDCPNLQQVLV